LKTVRNALDKKETCFREQNFKEKSQKLWDMKAKD
jgi:hypothetical protein